MPESTVSFSWQIDIGQIVTAVIFLLGLYGGAIRLYHLLDLRLSVLETMLKTHATTLTDHSAKMAAGEQQMILLMRQVYTLIGRAFPDPDPE